MDIESLPICIVNVDQVPGSAPFSFLAVALFETSDGFSAVATTYLFPNMIGTRSLFHFKGKPRPDGTFEGDGVSGRISQSLTTEQAAEAAEALRLIGGGSALRAERERLRQLI